MITNGNKFTMSAVNVETAGSLFQQLGSLLGVSARANGRFYLCDLCKANGINRWALNKSVRHTTKSNITNAQRVSAKCGLVPKGVTKLIRATTESPNHSFTQSDCIAEILEWSYNKPRGKDAGTNIEWYRLRDFNGYYKNAIAPDANWRELEIEYSLLSKLQQVTITETNTGDYSGYNFKLEPKYNGSLFNEGLYTKFSMKLGAGSGESIGTTTNMEIPIEYVASLDGAWRISLAVWIPSFANGKGAWGFFTSRMTIEQYFKTGSAGTELRQIFPDLATNPYLAKLMAEQINTNKGWTTFTVVPLLVKNLGNEKVNGLFNLRVVDGVTQAYCMPSGAKDVQFVCGEPPMVVYYKITYEVNAAGTSQTAWIENLDSVQHTFSCRVTKAYLGEIQSQQVVDKTVKGGKKVVIGGYNYGSGYSFNVKVIAQDGVAVE